MTPSREVLREKANSLAYWMYESSGKSKYVLAGREMINPETATEKIISLANTEVLAVLERLEGELQKFTAKHDQPMRDEALELLTKEKQLYMKGDV